MTTSTGGHVALAIGCTMQNQLWAHATLGLEAARSGPTVVVDLGLFATPVGGEHGSGRMGKQPKNERCLGSGRRRRKTIAYRLELIAGGLSHQLMTDP